MRAGGCYVNGCLAACVRVVAVYSNGRPIGHYHRQEREE